LWDRGAVGLSRGVDASLSGWLAFRFGLLLVALAAAAGPAWFPLPAPSAVEAFRR